ncbi:MAG: hypothetical protein K940chlam1_00771 [Candidatus Anoxychlamydiales bacterium]|nr:hypothetical protein [Candidatus Anoxychlamydiales bacterium]NGX36019.1 hypothetical protein [Candidatus Anoxychlamydiales bacterium]
MIDFKRPISKEFVFISGVGFTGFVYGVLNQDKLYNMEIFATKAIGSAILGSTVTFGMQIGSLAVVDLICLKKGIKNIHKDTVFKIATFIGVLTAGFILEQSFQDIGIYGAFFGAVAVYSLFEPSKSISFTKEKKSQ